MLNVDYSEVGTMGDTNGQAIPVGGMATGDIVLAIIAWDDTDGDPFAVDASEATAGDNVMTLSTTDTSDVHLWVMWAKPGV